MTPFLEETGDWGSCERPGCLQQALPARGFCSDGCEKTALSADACLRPEQVLCAPFETVAQTRHAEAFDAEVRHLLQAFGENVS